MPDNLSITSYGHCYQVLIITRLIKSGISGEDKYINASFNFAEHLAFKIYQNSKLQTPTPLDFDAFLTEYRDTFIIFDSILSRLKKRDYGIITDDGSFRMPYMYYFFLGRFLSTADKENRAIIEQMCEQSHVSSNYLTLLFVIHHTNNDEIIDNILLHTMCTLDEVDSAKLEREETDSFRELVNALPENILSSSSVEEERSKERARRNANKDLGEPENGFDAIYKILKSNDIMGQILRNKSSNLEKAKIKEIIEIVADSGLRLVKLLLMDKKRLSRVARYIQRKYPEHHIEDIKKFIQFASFQWTMGHIEKIVTSINVPEIRELVHEVVQQQRTPAYDLIGYFNHLDSTEKLTEGVKRELDTLLKRHDDFFLRKVLSMRTQHYMNTHRCDAPIAQSVCSSLNIRYTYRPSRSRE